MGETAARKRIKIEYSEKTNILLDIWKNRGVSGTYEPGSTFKLITSSAAIEEGLANSDTSGRFSCNGGIEVAGVRIKCWRYYRPHGSESLRLGLMNSCNPFFITIGQKLDTERFFKYFEAFGFTERTGIDEEIHR